MEGSIKGLHNCGGGRCSCNGIRLSMRVTARTSVSRRPIKFGWKQVLYVVLRSTCGNVCVKKGVTVKQSSQIDPKRDNEKCEYRIFAQVSNRSRNSISVEGKEQ